MAPGSSDHLAPRKPWSNLASAIIDAHKDKLVDSERGFLASVVNRRSMPSKHDLDRLNAIAKRVGLAGLSQA